MEPARLWILKAQDDFKVAHLLFEKRHWEHAGFLYQQSVEKALKAVIIMIGKPIPKVHDCAALAKLAGAPQKIINLAEFVTPYYFRTRYPDEPSAKVDTETVGKLRESATEVLEWTTKQC